MQPLNYHHLFHFWATARSGSIARASEQLHVTPTTISAQILQLEDSLGVKLFDRVGRGLELTEEGERVARRADSIFALGREIREAVRRPEKGETPALVVGRAGHVSPALLVRTLQPALGAGARGPVRVVAGTAEHLRAELEAGRIDLLIESGPSSGEKDPELRRTLADTGVGFFARPALAREAPDFPACLGRLPLLQLGPPAWLPGAVRAWLERRQLRPVVAAEVDDLLLLLALAQAGAGVVPLTLLSREAVREHYGLYPIGTAPELRVRWTLETTRCRLEEPAVRAVWEGIDLSLELAERRIAAEG